MENHQWGRLRGVQHPPQADIQNIRELLHGYGSEHSVLKELIQNAEDAGANHLDLILTPGDPGAAHPLLRTRGLCAVNDGAFAPIHLQAIFRLGLGTKGSDPRAIGRFGKGLKSVFALCEAFFVVAQTNRNEGWKEDTVCEFFNPWNGWRHTDWDNAFDAEMRAVWEDIRHALSTFGVEFPHWLAFWLPLRHSAHQQDAQGRVAWIHESTGGTLPGETAHLGTALAVEFMRLAPSLVTLRNLQRIRLIDEAGSTIWSRSENSICVPDPVGKTPPERVQGTMLMQNPAGQTDQLRYVGYAGTLPETRVAHTKEKYGWPTIVEITESDSSADQKAKGEPHFATILTSSPSPTGKLEVRWSVFFPVGEQPQGKREVSLTRIGQAITLNLHGFFFLDAKRLHVDGLQKHFEDAAHPCIEWNKIIAKEGTLAHLPKAITAFAQEHNLNDEQCQDLAEALRQTWIWEQFQADICRTDNWRPCWRSGNVTWECLSSTTPVLLIPRVSNADELRSMLPLLDSISNQFALTTRKPDGSLPGLCENNTDYWSERSVQALLNNVQLPATGAESTARWINEFLNELKLTPGIEKVIANLPLLSVRDVRTHATHRISLYEWETLCQRDQLFTTYGISDHWLRLLSEPFPQISFVVPELNLPRWFSGKSAPSCDETVVARIVLRQAELGGLPFHLRAKLWNAFEKISFPSPFIILAMRYLMHGNAAQAQDEHARLWLPADATGSQIWERLFDHLHTDENRVKPWQLLEGEWKNIVSGKVQEKLSISTVNAEGLWEELMKYQSKLHRLEFTGEKWADNEIASFIQGLHQVGKTKDKLNETLILLRRLRIYRLASQAQQRVAVADEAGQLDAQFILAATEISKEIPQDLIPLWQSFLSETKIVARLQSDIPVDYIETQIFQRTDEQGQPYTVTLDWNYIVRRCLEAEEPGRWAQLILQAFAIKGTLSGTLTTKLKSTVWLPLEVGGYIRPDSIAHIEGLEEELHDLFDPTKDGWAGILALPRLVREHRGFNGLSNPKLAYFPSIKEAFEMLKLWLEEKPKWHLGLEKELHLADLGPLLEQLKGFEDLPIVRLLLKVCSLNEGKLKPLVQEYVLPVVLKKFDYEQEGLSKIKQILGRLQSLKIREAFDAYLQQACKDNIIRELLPELSLVNQRGEWKSARQLIWPSENLDPAAQVCNEQAKILSPLHEESAKREVPISGQQEAGILSRGNQLLAQPDFDVEAEKVEEYLRPFTAGNVGANLIAAFVVVLGGHPKIRALLEDLLRTGLGQTPDVFMARLFGEREERPSVIMDSVRFLIDIERAKKREERSLTDELLMVALTDEIKTLIVGDANKLWFNYFYKNHPCRILQLRWIEEPNHFTDQELVNIFAATIETVYLKVHCNGVASLCPSNLKEILTDIADTGQVALRRSQLYLLDMAEARLRELGVKGMPQFQEILQEFDDARQARVDAEDLSVQAPPKAQQRRKQADEKRRSATDRLVKLLEGAESADVRYALVQAVRRKMTDFQYSLASVLQELFQNADDAVAEWKEMRQVVEPVQERFVLHLSNQRKTLEIFHWGRPINQYESPGFTAGRSRGYDQDLVKMLTLNFSDKGVGKEEGQTIVTGLFGLGFKSVFFVAEEPQVISGRLAFEIRGGFYPIPLATGVATEMRQKAEQLGEATATPTVIRLRWKPEEGLACELEQAVAHFTRIAPLLTIFSRHLQTLIVSDDDSNNVWAMVEESLTETGAATFGRVGNHHYLCFHCQLASEQYPATILFQLNPDGITPLEDDLTGLWITTPTAERSRMRWALNAPFKPDAGRQQMALTNRENKIIAKKVADAWGKALIEFYDETEKNWPSIKKKLKLHDNVGDRKWWQQLWQEMSRDAPILQWDNVHEGGHVLHWIAWGESVGAMRRLIEERRAIPSGLPGNYEAMLKLSEVKYVLKGVLAETDNGCFTQVEIWKAIQSAIPPGQVVGQQTGNYLRQISSGLLLEPLTIRKVLSTEVGPQNQVNPASADRIGSLLEKCEAIFETYSQVWNEDGLREWMTQLMFRAQDGSYRFAGDLVCNRPVTDLIEKDEALRAPFAPEGAVLFTGYSDSAIRLFVKARVRLAANAMLLAEWVQQVSDSEKLSAVFIYIVEGELGQALADKLGYTWLETKRDTSAFKSLSEEQWNEVERKFSKGRVWNTFNFPFSIPTPIERPVKQMMDAKDAFRRVWQWWNRGHDHYVTEYERKTYSIGVPGNLPWPGEDAWEKVTIPSPHTQWLLLFVRAALVPLGFNNIGRDQGFLQFLNDRNLLEAFGNSSNEPQFILEAIDEWLDSSLENTQFHFQMRQFVAFYAVARNLEDFLESLRAADAQGTAYAFQNVFSPKANSSLIGTGITAPPITGMLGMGSCQLLRELFRLGRLSNPAGFPYAFTPLRKVRRLCTQLFGTEYKSEGARSSLGIFAELQRLGSELGLDPTFNRCFDLPFQFLAEDDALCKKELGQSLNGEQSTLSIYNPQSDLEDFYGTDEPS